MVKAVLFDMDGVLVDSFEAWLRLMNATARHFGAPEVERAKFRAVYGQPTEEDVRIFFPGRTVAEVESFYTAHFGEFSQHVRSAPEAPHVLMILRHQGIRTGVITNTPSSLAHEILKSANIQADVVVGGNDVAQAKPAPDMVYRACELLGVSPSEALVVGDSPYDRQAAVAAGARFAGLGTEGDPMLQQLADVLELAEP
jgi:phosphoglycolate phosphatase/AHBA synthesis associated protein